MLNAEQRHQILEKVEHYYTVADKHYNRKFPRPIVRFDLTGVTAGTADYVRNVIRYNHILAAGHFDTFLARTVPHEVAHIVDFATRDEDEGNRRMMNFLRGRRQKREVHGPRWQAVMRLFGVRDIGRCHSYDTSNVERRKTRYEYLCACGHKYALGPKVHKCVEAGNPRGYYCRKCKTPLASTMRQATKPPVRPAVATVQQTRTRTTTPGTKIHHAVQVVGTHGAMSATAVIGLLMRELSMSKAGATTYYYQAKKIIRWLVANT